MSTARAGLRPRQQVHRGTVRAWAFWFDPALLGEAEVRRRILTMWTPGVSVRAVAGGYLVGMSAPRDVACGAAPGLPLTLEQGVLTSAPLSQAERQHPSLQEGAVVLVLGGKAQAFSPEALPRVDVAAWLDVSDWTVLPARTLAAPPPPVSVLESVPAPSRERFGPGMPELAPEARAMLARMEGRDAPESAVALRQGWWERLRARFSRDGTVLRHGPNSGGSRPGWMARLRAAFSLGGVDAAEGTATPRKAGLLARWRARLQRSSEVATQRALPPPAPPQGPSPWSRMSEWMLRNTLLGVWMQQRKAEYVRRLFEMFEEGNLHEALRHAIPLGQELSENARVALGLPGPREQLAIQLEPKGAGAVFAGGPDIFAALRQRYREAFRRLEREGRIDEAAFVLTELLGAHEEAVSFLEKHGRFKLAAELAEGRNLAPGIVVRQWFLAKDVARAIAVARRSGAFADALVRLERTNPPEARALRRLWAETLAASGDSARAVQVIWPLTEDRGRAREWLERGVAGGGATGARLLALWATAFPDGLTVAGAQVRELLESDAPGRANERFVFGLSLAGEDASPNRTALAVPTLRALLRDRAAGNARFTSDLDLIHRLLSAAPDGTLRADLPSLADCIHPAWRDNHSHPRVDVTVRATEVGSFTLHDVMALPDGRLLYALGEAGARLVRQDGRTVAHFDVPAFVLVPSIHGDRALALARRGDVWRLSRLDLMARRSKPWCDVALTGWAPSYDGDVWFVACENTVMMVDALAADFRALWRVPDLSQPVSVIAADATHMSFLVGTEARWTYVLANGPTLRDRSELPPEVAGDPGAPSSQALAPDGEAALLWTSGPRTSSPVWLKPVSFRASTRQTREREALRSVSLTQDWYGELLDLEGDWQLQLFDKRDALRAVLTFEGDVRPQVRLAEGTLLAFDARGRGLWLDLESGEVRHLAVS
ncbi:bpX6 domain-containing protein [Myxococcus sp. Y35]|uniref:bpX6 domain-containing protein n=1 Tax=Pseudomyxococcus flavus TaxID=3115648 RepID=UPI003CE6D993